MKPLKAFFIKGMFQQEEMTCVRYIIYVFFTVHVICISKGKREVLRILVKQYIVAIVIIFIL